MREEGRAARALHSFSQAGYDVLKPLQSSPVVVQGLLVSDCAVFLRGDQPESAKERLYSLLGVVEKINRKLLQSNILITTSVAYGPFKYEERLEFPGIEKNPIYGNAYLAAFLDNEGGTPRLKPGQCRILTSGLPPELSETGGDLNGRLVKAKTKYLYFYWMLPDGSGVRDFKKRYNGADRSRYQGILDVLLEVATPSPPGSRS